MKKTLFVLMLAIGSLLHAQTKPEVAEAKLPQLTEKQKLELRDLQHQMDQAQMQLMQLQARFNQIQAQLTQLQTQAAEVVKKDLGALKLDPEKFDISGDSLEVVKKPPAMIQEKR